MSRQESVVSPLTPGAGRKFSYVWGACGVTNAGNDFVGTNTDARPTGTPDNLWTMTITGAPPATRGVTTTNGRVAERMTSNTGTGYEVYAQNAQRFTMPFCNVKGTANLSNLDDFYCWEVSAVLAWNAIPGAITGDTGLVIANGVNGLNPTRGRIRAGSFMGIELGPSNTGQLSLIVRQADAGALTFNQLTPTQPDLTQFNRYALRLVGPTASTEAQLKVFVNNVQQFALPWGAGTVLPDITAGAGVAMGYFPCLLNFAAAGAATVTMHVPPFGLTVCAAPNETMLSAVGT